MSDIPLGVLDLVPISSGSIATEALRNSIDLARQTDRFGCARYWFAEHHLNPGVADTSPAVLLALTAAATSTIRLGSGAPQLGRPCGIEVVAWTYGWSSRPAPATTTLRPWPARFAPARAARRGRGRCRSADATTGISAPTAVRAGEGARPDRDRRPRTARWLQGR